MKAKQTIAYLLMMALFAVMLPQISRAAATPTVSFSNSSGDAVQVTITGDASKSIEFSFLPPGASSVTTLNFGTTNSSGSYTTTISSGGYGIPAGSPVYVIINGMQSSTVLWPSYTSSIYLNKSEVQVAVGQSSTVSSYSSLILAANSKPASISTSVSGSQATITGASAGTGYVTLCGINVGCGSVSVTVGSNGQTEISFSESNVVINSGQTKNVSIFGGSNSGYVIHSNSNTTAVYAKISGQSGVISLYGNSTPGTANIIICAADEETNCSTLSVTNINTSYSNLSFSPASVTLIPGLSQSVIVSGGTNDSYYISSNSNSSAATASISGNILTFVGGSTEGSTVVTVCSTVVNAMCGTVTATLTSSSDSSSAASLSFSQNVVTVAATDTTNVTVSGGNGSGYVISGNSNPSVVTPSLVGSSNVISLYGVTTGSAIITVCSASGGSACASIYVNVGPTLTAIYFSDNNISLSSGGSKIITVSGGTGEGKVISANTNPSAIAASLNDAGTILTLTAGSVPGSTIITVCAKDYSTNCATLNAKLTGSAASNSDNNSSSSDTTTNNNSSGTSDTATAAQTQLQKILAEASAVFAASGIVKNESLETQTKTSYLAALRSGLSDISDSAEQKIVNFIAYGTETTLSLGAGERAGVVSSYKKAFGKLPATESEWADAVKIANGRWPGESNEAALASAKTEFKRVYKRDANMSNPNDNAAVTIIAYGLRPASRNLNSEKAAILSFKAIYGHAPVSALAWDIVRAIAYSGATR